tara:strand:- start:117 stop:719 length:603 start_codon:yes stop_codon:yes gene_type:complete
MNSSKKLLVNLSLGASILTLPILAEENSGFYATGSIGYNKISDLDRFSATNPNYENNKLKIQFDDGIAYDLGFGYDFGTARIEATWNRGQSPSGLDSREVFKTDASVDSLLVSGFYDFRSSMQWSPFIGLSVGSTRIEHANKSDTGLSYGAALGISYKTSDSTEFFVKTTGIVTPELTLGDSKVKEGSYGNATVGVRFHF